MRNERLRIGKIPYINLFPIFHVIEKLAGNDRYTIIEGVPSVLNRSLREGSIDISPSSSIEHLRHPDKYDVISNHSVSADGPVRSIYLFSRVPLEALDGQTILTSSQSETSVALLKIICRKFYHLTCTFSSSGEPIETALRSHPSYLLIGDDAISQFRRWQGLHVYDLGDLWKQHTGLPFTYALWLVRKECARTVPAELASFVRDLDRAKELALSDLGRIASAAPFKGILSENALVDYWRGISYDLTEGHLKGLGLFRQYATELGLLGPSSS